MLELLVSRGANVNAHFEGNTTLHNIVMDNRPDSVAIIRRLGALGANVNVQDRDGYGMTPLHVAVRYHPNHANYCRRRTPEKVTLKKSEEMKPEVGINVDIIKEMLALGANFNAQSRMGFSPLEDARRYGLHKDGINALLEAVEQSNTALYDLLEPATAWWSGFGAATNLSARPRVSSQNVLPSACRRSTEKADSRALANATGIPRLAH